MREILKHITNLRLRVELLLFLVFIFQSGIGFPADSSDTIRNENNCDADWMYRGQLGLSSHFFALHPKDVDVLVNRFDVNRVAAQANEAGAAWFLLPLHHQPWVMNAPNTTYDGLLGNGDYTASRDLPLDLWYALAPYGIRLMLYVNLRLDPGSAAPSSVRKAMGGWPPTDEMIKNISSVYREFSLRYGERVSGWWVDAAGLPEYARAPEREKWFSILADALRAGNPKAIIAFNPGLRVIRYSQQDSFSAGETTGLNTPPNARWINGAQWHEWVFLGKWWAADGNRFSDQELAHFISKVTHDGGALTLEVGTMRASDHQIATVDINNKNIGYIDPDQIQQIKRLYGFRRNKLLDSNECKKQQ